MIVDVEVAWLGVMSLGVHFVEDTTGSRKGGDLFIHGLGCCTDFAELDGHGMFLSKNKVVEHVTPASVGVNGNWNEDFLTII